MLDRHFAGDVALALTLAISIAALARPETVSSAQDHDTGVVARDARPVSLLR